MAMREQTVVRSVHAQEVNDNDDDDNDEDKYTVRMTKANMQSTEIISTKDQ